MSRHSQRLLAAARVGKGQRPLASVAIGLLVCQRAFFTIPRSAVICIAPVEHLRKKRRV